MPTLSTAPRKHQGGRRLGLDPGATPTWRQAGREGLGTPQRRRQLLPSSKHHGHAGGFLCFDSEQYIFQIKPTQTQVQ